MSKYRLKEVFTFEGPKQYQVQRRALFIWYNVFSGTDIVRGSWSESYWYQEAKAKLEELVAADAFEAARNRAYAKFKPAIMHPPLPDVEPEN